MGPNHLEDPRIQIDCRRAQLGPRSTPDPLVDPDGPSVNPMTNSPPRDRLLNDPMPIHRQPRNDPTSTKVMAAPRAPAILWAVAVPWMAAIPRLVAHPWAAARCRLRRIKKRRLQRVSSKSDFCGAASESIFLEAASSGFGPAFPAPPVRPSPETPRDQPPAHKPCVHFGGVLRGVSVGNRF